MAHRPDNWNDWTCGLELTELCAALHGIATGSTDGWLDDRTAGFAAALAYADEHWQAGIARDETYDNSVRALVRATLAEWKAFTAAVNLKD